MKIPRFEHFFEFITDLLMKKRASSQPIQADFERLCYEIRPGDVLLVAGRSRVSEVIRIVTLSPWSHAALYIGRLYEIMDPVLRKKITSSFPVTPDDQLLIESVMGKGTVVTPLSFYLDDHSRICRPRYISKQDVDKVIAYSIEHLGYEYDTRQIFDLMRYLFPWGIFPRRWRSSLFAHKAGIPTKDSCATLIASAFESVNFPVLPIVKVKKRKQDKTEFIRLNPRLVAPSDFDYSPYFDIIKYPMFEYQTHPSYKEFPWISGIVGDKEGNIYPEKQEQK